MPLTQSFEELHSTAAHFRRVRVTEQWQNDLFYAVRPVVDSRLVGLCCILNRLVESFQSRKYKFNLLLSSPLASAQRRLIHWQKNK